MHPAQKAVTHGFCELFWGVACDGQRLTLEHLNELRNLGLPLSEIAYTVAAFGIHVLAAQPSLPLPVQEGCPELLTQLQRKTITAIHGEEQKSKAPDAFRYFRFCAQFVSGRAQYWPQLWEIVGIEMPEDIAAVLTK